MSRDSKQAMASEQVIVRISKRLPRRRRYLFLAAASLLLASGLMAASVSAWPKGGDQYALLVVLAALCLLPGVYSILRRHFDLFEPIYAFAISTMVYFVMVPMVLLARDSYYLLGWDQRAYANTVTVLAMLAMIGFGLGYYWRSGTPNLVPTRDLRKEHGDPATRRFMWRWSVALLLFFLGLNALWIVVARIPLSALWIFGQASYGDAWRLNLGPQIGYLYGAREALPACLLMAIAFRSGHRWPIAAVALFALLLLFFSGVGARFRVLMLVLSVAMFYFLERSKRPRIWQALLVAFFVFYFVIGAIGFYRSQTLEAGSLRAREVGVDQFSLDEAWQIMVSNSEIATSTALLVHVVPEYEPYFMGASFLNVFTQPIPRFLWADKPKAVGQELFDELWPPGTTLPFFVIFYLNFGPMAIVPGMMLWGWVSRKIYDMWRLHPRNELAQVQLAVYWPFLIHMYGRGGDNFAFNVYALIFVLAPIWIMFLLSRIRAGRATKTGPSLNAVAKVYRG